MKRLIVAGVASLALLAGCATFGKPVADQGQGVGFELGITATPVIDPSFARIDIYRMTTAQSLGTGAGVNTISVAEKYSYLAFSLGNGIYIDTNRNIYFSVRELFGLTKDDDARIVTPEYEAIKESDWYRNSERKLMGATNDVIYSKTKGVFESNSSKTLGKALVEVIDDRFVTRWYNYLGFQTNDITLAKDDSTGGYAYKMTRGIGLLPEMYCFKQGENFQYGGSPKQTTTISCDGTQFRIGSSLKISKTISGYYIDYGNGSIKKIDLRQNSIDVTKYHEPNFTEILFGGNQKIDSIKLSR